MFFVSYKNNSFISPFSHRQLSNYWFLMIQKLNRLERTRCQATKELIFFRQISNFQPLPIKKPIFSWIKHFHSAWNNWHANSVICFEWRKIIKFILPSSNNWSLYWWWWLQLNHLADEVLSRKMSTRTHYKGSSKRYTRFSMTISTAVPMKSKWSTSTCATFFGIWRNKLPFDLCRLEYFQWFHLNRISIYRIHLQLYQINRIKWQNVVSEQVPFSLELLQFHINKNTDFLMQCL